MKKTNVQNFRRNWKLAHCNQSDSENINNNNNNSVALERDHKLYRPSDRHLSEKLVQTFADRGVSRSQRG
jgi:hypothetical protein